MRWRRLIMVALVLPALLLVTGCGRAEIGFEILDPNRTQVKLTEVVFKSSKQADGTFESSFGPVSDVSQICEYLLDTVREYAKRQATSMPFEDEKQLGCSVVWTQEAPVELTPRGHVTTQGKVVEFMTRSETIDLLGDIYEKNPGTLVISVTFPGKVLSHNGSGTVSGKTVTWVNPKEYFQMDGLQASGWLPLTWRDFILPGVIVGVLLVVATATYLSIRHARPRAGQPSSEAADVVVPDVEEIDSSKPVKDFADD